MTAARCTALASRWIVEFVSRWLGSFNPTPVEVPVDRRAAMCPDGYFTDGDRGSAQSCRGLRTGGVMSSCHSLVEVLYPAWCGAPHSEALSTAGQDYRMKQVGHGTVGTLLTVGTSY